MGKAKQELHADGRPKVYLFPGGTTTGKRTGFEQRVGRTLREYLSARQLDRCWHCGGKMTPARERGPDACTLDHLFDREYGGELSPENCVAAHSRCNNARNGSKRKVGQ